MNRNTAFKISQYGPLGSTFFDSIAHSNLFRGNNVHNFGVMTSRLFASTNNLGVTNKRWNYLTEAADNYEILEPGTNEYSWQNVGDADIDLRIVKKYVSAASQVGKNKATFLVGVDHQWYGHPATLKTEDDNAPLLKIIGQPYAEGAHYVLECQLQDGTEDAWLDDSFLDAGRSLVQGGSMISNEQNPDYRDIGPWTDMVHLRSQVGQVGANVQFTDRFLKMEMAAAKKGKNNSLKYTNFDGKTHSSAFSRGSVYYMKDGSVGDNSKADIGFFVSVAEQRLLEAVEYDCNFMAEFGRLETSTGSNGRTVRVAPGWRQLYRDGQYFPHNGSFTLQWLIDKLHMVLFRRRGFKNRKPMLVSGTGGITFISQLIADNALLSNVSEPGFAVRENSTPTGVHDREYDYGFMFTKFSGPMGVTVQVMYDPSKDDSTVYKQTAPGSFLPLESFQIDILDFGETEDAMEHTKGTNITMIKEDMADYYFSIANAFQKNGAITDGSNTYDFGKELKIYREKSGSLCIWDTWSIGRIEWIV